MEKTYYDRVALVGYVHVDPGLEERLKERRFRVALVRLKTISADARRRVERAVENLASTKDLTPEQRKEAEEIGARFEEVRKGLEKLEPDRTLTKAQREELLGLRASSLKREAEAAFCLAEKISGDSAAEWLERSRNALRGATEAYGRAAKVSRDHHWTWVQWLVLLAVQHGHAIQEHATDWAIAEAAARDAAEREAPSYAGANERREIAKDAIWGWGSLCELYLIRSLVGRPAAMEEAKKCLDSLVDGSRALGTRDPIDATRDQLARYEAWWGKDKIWNLPKEIAAAATELCAHLLDKSRGAE
jgi:hypothetical protein